MYPIFASNNRLVLCSFAVFLASLVVAASPTLRKSVQNLVLPQREILSIVTGGMYKNSPIHKVVKLRTEGGIEIEVYSLTDKKEQLLDRIQIPDIHDAYYEINSRPTNLALNDMDGDGFPEIIAPTYNLDWQPKLNIFKFNKENGYFETY